MIMSKLKLPKVDKSLLEFGTRVKNAKYGDWRVNVASGQYPAGTLHSTRVNAWRFRGSDHSLSGTTGLRWKFDGKLPDVKKQLHTRLQAREKAIALQKAWRR